MKLTRLWNNRRDLTARDPFEPLESRTMMSVVPSLVGLTVDGQSTNITIEYNGNINVGTIGNGDVQYSANGRAPVAGTLMGSPQVISATRVRATYHAPAYDGAWGFTDTGTYLITTPAGRVLDTDGHNLTTENIGQHWLWFDNPKATLVSQSITPGGWLITIDYTGLNGINASTIDSSDIAIVGTQSSPGRSVVSTSVQNSQTTRVVYNVTAPEGAWDFSKTGAWDIVVNFPNIKDNSNREANYGNLGEFYLWFNTPRVQVQPTTLSGNDWLIPIVFSSMPGSSINPTPLNGDGAITVSGPGGFSAPGHLNSIAQNANGSYTGVFRVVANGGSWDYTDNGTYAVNVTSGRVVDTQSRSVAAVQVASYSLFFENPFARMVLPTNPTQTRWDVSVDFTDNASISLASITAGSIRIVGPNGSTLPVTLLSVTNPTSGVTRATFRLSASLANGNYQVWVNANGVRDNLGNPINENQLASFFLFF